MLPIVHMDDEISPLLLISGQNEPTTTNASIGHSIHWMGYAFSFCAKWGSS